MTKIFDVILSGGTLVNQDGEGVRDVGVSAGRIAHIGDLSRASAGETIDCRGLHVLPGVVDTQVHFREPGFAHKEDLESGSRGAVLGGVTAVFEMPNTNPLTTGEAELADKVARASGRMHCDFAFWVGGTHENAELLGDLERLPGAAGIKVFMGSSTGSLLVADDEGVARVLSNTRRRAAFHSEDEDRLNERKSYRIEGDPSSHPVWRDVETALRSTRRLLTIAREKRALIHVLHVTTAEEIDVLAQHKDLASVEVTPNHLVLDASDYKRLGALAQMNPPVREARHRDALWEGLRQGVVDVIGSDHAPHTLDEKAQPYPEESIGDDRRSDARAATAQRRQRGQADACAFRRSHQRRAVATLRDRGQGKDRQRLRRRLHHRRHETARNDLQFMDRVTRRLDAIRRNDRHRLAGRDIRAWRAGDVGWRDRDARDRRADPLSCGPLSLFGTFGALASALFGERARDAQAVIHLYSHDLVEKSELIIPLHGIRAAVRPDIETE